MRGEWKNKERRARTIGWLEGWGGGGGGGGGGVGNVGREEEDGCWASSVHGPRKEKELEN